MELRLRGCACACLWLLGCSGAPAGAEVVVPVAGGGAGAGLAPPAPAETDASEAAGPAPAAARFTCDETATAEPAELRRLTMTQVRNTLRDLARWALGDARQAEAALAEAGLDALPEDRRLATPREPDGSLRRLDQALDQTHVDETYRVAVALGRALAAPERWTALAGACATDGDASNDEDCVEQFIARFGARALRRPLDADDARFYRVVYGSDPTPDPAAFGDVIAVMLASPQFLYFVEHGDEEILADPGSYRLGAHELASRLSYHFWQTLPDDALWQAAEDGSLLQPEVLSQQVQRLIDDPRARDAMAELFADVLALDDVPALDAHARDPAFAAFAGSDLPGPELRGQVIDEALDLFAHYTWTDPGGVAELLTSERSFARGEQLARIYGVPPWDGVSAPPALPPGERAGLLTRAWFLASGTASTRPIRRGVLLRRRLLCDELAPPPAAVDPAQAGLAEGKTTRERVAELTEQPGTACASCHANAINPLGFAFEGFDALGRARTHETVRDASGAVLAELPVDSATVPRVTPDDERASSGPAELMSLILQSGKVEACLARHYFRFAFGRYEDLARDGCALERLRARLHEAGLRAMLAEAGLLPELQQRRFEP